MVKINQGPNKGLRTKAIVLHMLNKHNHTRKNLLSLYRRRTADKKPLLENSDESPASFNAATNNVVLEPLPAKETKISENK